MDPQLVKIRGNWFVSEAVPMDLPGWFRIKLRPAKPHEIPDDEFEI